MRILLFVLLLFFIDCDTANNDNSNLNDNTSNVNESGEKLLLDTLLVLFPDVLIDSSNYYIKNDSSLTVLNKDSSLNYMDYYSYVISQNGTMLILKNVNSEDSSITTVELLKAIGDSLSLNGNAWIVNEVKLEELDTFAVYKPLVYSDVIIYYPVNSTFYELANNVSIDDIDVILEDDIQQYLKSKDSLILESIFDSLITIAGEYGIDSTMNYVKYGSLYILSSVDSSSNENIEFEITSSSDTAQIEIEIVDAEDTISIYLNYYKLLGNGEEFIGTAWILKEASMTAFDTSSKYLLNTDQEKQIFYFLDSTVYIIENGITINNIFDTLGAMVVSIDTVDTVISIDTVDTNKTINLLDTLKSLIGSANIDSSKSYKYNSDTLTWFYSYGTAENTIKYKFHIDNEDLWLITLIDSFEVQEVFEVVKNIDSIELEKNIWKLKSLTVKNSDSAFSHLLNSNEQYLIYLNNDKVYLVEDQFDINEEIDSLLNKFPKYGYPMGIWFADIYKELNIDSDTSFLSDTADSDFVTMIIDIADGHTTIYEYDVSNKYINVNNMLINLSKGGSVVFDAYNSISVMEKDSVMQFTIIQDYTAYGGLYHKEEYICKPYYENVPPDYWVVDTINSNDATNLSTNGEIVLDTIIEKDSIHLYKFKADSGEVYNISVSNVNDDVEFDLFYIEDNMTYYVKENENFTIIKSKKSNTLLIELSSLSNMSEYEIFVKKLDVTKTSDTAIGNWYLSELSIDSDTLNFVDQDSTLWYLTLSSDSAVLYQQENGTKGTIEGDIYFTSDMKLYMFESVFDYFYSNGTLVMADSGITLFWKQHAGSEFPPDKYIDLNSLFRNKRIIKFKN